MLFKRQRSVSQSAGASLQLGAHVHAHIHTQRRERERERRWRGIHPLQQPPALPRLPFSLCVHLPSPFFYPLCYLQSFETAPVTDSRARDVVCAAAWCSASFPVSHSSLLVRAQRQTSRAVFILQELNDYLENWEIGGGGGTRTEHRVLCCSPSEYFIWLVGFRVCVSVCLSWWIKWLQQPCLLS